MNPDFPVVHVAAHTFVDAERPLLSHLTLAPSARSTGVLYGYEVERLPLRRTRLVVLAGCETAAGPLAGGEGVMSLARSFLAAGAGAVVASLWRVDDSLTTSLMLSFHRALRAGSNPAAAMRAAQLELQASTDPALRSPRVWAAFQTMGTVAP